MKDKNVIVKIILGIVIVVAIFYVILFLTK